MSIISMNEQDRKISEVVAEERFRLHNFIRRRVPDPSDVEDILQDELELALDELPEEQREVFIAHELEGRSFKELSAETGVNVKPCFRASATRCFISANDCGAFTTSFRRSEEHNNKKETERPYESDETDFDSATGDPGGW